MTDTELSNQEIIDFTRELQRRKAEIDGLRAENHAAGAVVELDQQSVGRLARMDAMQRQEMAKETRRRREAELRRIEAALARVDTGEYGLCVACEEPIARKRLQLDPSIPQCLDCARGDH